jgi:hypothetical protein
MSFETKKPNIVGDNSFSDTLFHMAERLDLKDNAKPKYLDRTMEQVEFNGKKVWKITTYEPIDEKKEK